jgi:Zn-dependent peptidase ImmA (M78 family)
LLNPIKDDYYRQRFDVAHELGHLVMHLDAEPGGRTVEDQAHRFAAEFLMPEKEIVDLLPHKADWQRLGQLKQQWNVSLQALLYRARSLKVMSDVTYRNAMTTISSRGWRRREPGPMPLLEQPSLLPRAIELLETEANADELDLATECQVPLGLFRTITSRTPVKIAGSPSGRYDTNPAPVSGPR